MKLHIYSAIKGYKNLKPVRFHMPGHKGKNVLKLNFSEDVTELSVIENEKAIKKAEEDVAKIYNAYLVRFLTDGATSGILSALYAVSDYSDEVIINRDAHKSVYNALTLLKKSPVIVGRVYTDGYSDPVTLTEIKTALESNPKVKAVCLTYPDYYGRTFDIKSVSEFLKEKGITLIIDGAHGGLMKYSAPDVYGGKYADILIESAHKTFPTLNQGAAIFCYKKELSEKIEEGVNVFSTTSPSYLILSSIEYGFKYFAEKPDEVHKKRAEILRIKEELVKSGVTVLPSADDFKLRIKAFDNGESIEKKLESKKIFSELSGKDEILFMLSPFNRKGDIKKLKREIIKAVTPVSSDNKERKELTPKRSMDYLTAKRALWEEINIKEAENRVSAVDAGLFPPCFPLVTAGEIIDKRIIEILSEKNNVFGVKNGKIRVIKRK